MQTFDPTQNRKPRPPLGRWLLAQRTRADAIGELARAAAHDPAFPADGGFGAISTRLNQVGAEGDMHLALDDAELDWACW